MENKFLTSILLSKTEAMMIKGGEGDVEQWIMDTIKLDPVQQQSIEHLVSGFVKEQSVAR